jgi:hypothetical protein
MSDVTSVAARPFSRKVIRWLPWVSALVFVAGGIAFLIAYYGNTAHPHHPGVRPGNPVDVSGTPPTVPVDPAARLVAGKFIVTAVTRQNLAEAWKITEPGSPLRGGYTFKRWMSGDIPVQPFPAKAIAGASFKVQASHPGNLTLNVYIFAKPKSGVTSQNFYIVLRSHGTGKSKRWLVNYWVPASGAYTVPSVGAEGG